VEVNERERLREERKRWRFFTIHLYKTEIMLEEENKQNFLMFSWALLTNISIMGNFSFRHLAMSRVGTVPMIHHTLQLQLS
jgi:hypothetical protein